MSDTEPNQPEHPSEWDSDRILYAGISVAVAIVVIILLNVVSASSDAFATTAGRILVDYQFGTESDGPNYFAVQNLMWIAFFFGIAELIHRWMTIRQEVRETSLGYLPEDDRTLLTRKDLPAIYKKVNVGNKTFFLPRLIGRIVMQFQKSGSVEQSNALLNSSLDLFMHEVDLRYTVLRYTNWLIPTLGFLGTVIGISMALGYAGSGDPSSGDLLGQTTLKLGVAFYTTGVALAMSGILVLGMNLIQAAEERVLNRCGQYCLENLINRLFEKPN